MYILCVEGNPEEADRICRHLTGVPSHFRLDVVHTQREALERLSQPEARQYDLLLTNLRLPDGGALDVLTHVRERALPVAVAVIADSPDESTVANVLQAGADECLEKGPDFLSSLPRIMDFALARFRGHSAMREAMERYHSLCEGVPIGIYRTTPGGEILDANRALVQMLGYPDRESLLQIRSTDTYVDREDRRRWKSAVDRDGVVRNFELQLRRRDGSPARNGPRPRAWAADRASGSTSATSCVHRPGGFAAAHIESAPAGLVARRETDIR